MMLTIRRVTIALGSVCLVAMILVTVVNVTSRYLFSKPIFGAAEMTQFLLGVAVFAGMYAITRDRGQVNVSLFEGFFHRHLPLAYKVIYDTSVLLGVIFVSAILLWHAFDLFQFPEHSIVLGLPIFWIIAVIVVLSLLSILAAWQTIKDPSLPQTHHSMNGHAE